MIDAPWNPENAMATSPAVTRAIGMPLKHFGTSANSSLARTPAKTTIAIVKPTAEKNAYNTDSIKPYPLSITSRAHPRIAQFVVIRGKYIPRAE